MKLVHPYRSMGALLLCAVASAELLMVEARSAQAEDGSVAQVAPHLLSLSGYQDSGAADASFDDEAEESSSSGWTLIGPFFLRSADPEPVGELEIKNIFGYSREKGGEEEYEYELEVEYGLVKDHELLFFVPFEIGEGRVDGNGDATLGWHWRWWDEQDHPFALAFRNLVRLPTGVDSSGVDYTLRGLVTKTLVPGKLRGHFNPFLRSVNGDNEEEARDFQYGAAWGVDYRYNEQWTFIADYFYRSGEEKGDGDNHALELGADWRIAPPHEMGFALEIGLDGDHEGPSFGAKISYILAIER